MNQPGGASLDGEPPASTILATLASRARSLSGFGGGAPIVNQRARAVLVESRSPTPPQQCLPATALFAPGRACDIASDVLCRDPRRARHRCRAPSALGPPDPLLRPSRQRPPARRARTPSIARVLPPPVVLALARLHVGSRRARHRFRCSRARGFRHREPASDASSLAEPAHLSVFAPAS